MSRQEGRKVEERPTFLFLFERFAAAAAASFSSRVSVEALGLR
jgi:hypothetical protein